MELIQYEQDAISTVLVEVHGVNCHVDFEVFNVRGGYTNYGNEGIDSDEENTFGVRVLTVYLEDDLDKTPIELPKGTYMAYQIKEFLINEDLIEYE